MQPSIYSSNYKISSFFLIFILTDNKARRQTEALICRNDENTGFFSTGDCPFMTNTDRGAFKNYNPLESNQSNKEADLKCNWLKGPGQTWEMTSMNFHRLKQGDATVSALNTASKNKEGTKKIKKGNDHIFDCVLISTSSVWVKKHYCV